MDRIILLMYVLSIAIVFTELSNCTILLHSGGVKEEGSHSELLEMKGVYHGLWMKQ